MHPLNPTMQSKVPITRNPNKCTNLQFWAIATSEVPGVASPLTYALSPYRVAVPTPEGEGECDHLKMSKCFNRQIRRVASNPTYEVAKFYGDPVNGPAFLKHASTYNCKFTTQCKFRSKKPHKSHMRYDQYYV